MKSSKDINLETYNLSLLTAKEDVLNPRTSTNWALFAYDGVTNRLKLADSGVGGVSELTHKLHPRRLLYALCRVNQPNTTHTHIAMIIWVGKDMDDYRRAQCSAHIPAIKSFFKEVHFFLPASSLEEVTEERIFSVASKVVELMERERVRQVLRHEEREETVGTNYKRTIAAAEIRKTHRENFWAQAEREEEERKEEERRRAAEDRRRRERERVQQEKREAEERDRRMNEKLKKIQEQRQLQAQAEAEKHKQEKFKWVQQQREFDEEMRARCTQSESVEKAAEAAVLVSLRKNNPREFFRQLSLTTDTFQSPPNSPQTVRSSNRKLHRSLTDAFVFIQSSSSSPTSPGSPKQLSPFFPSPPSLHIPTVFSYNAHTQPQYTHSCPKAQAPHVPFATKHNSTVVFPAPHSGQTVESPSPLAEHTAVSLPSPTEPTVISPTLPKYQTVVPPALPNDQTAVSPTLPKDQTVVPPALPNDQTSTPPTAEQTVASLPSLSEQTVIFPAPPSGQSVAYPSSSSCQIVVSQLLLNSQTVVCSELPSGQVVSANIQIAAATPAAPSTPLSVFLQPSSPVNAQLSLTDLVDSLTFYPPPPQPTADSDQSEGWISPHLSHSSISVTQNPVCSSDTSNSMAISQIHSASSVSPLSSSMILPAQPPPKAPSRPLPALPLRDDNISTGENGEREGDNREEREQDVLNKKEDQKIVREMRKEGKENEEIQENKEDLFEPWVSAQASMITILEEEGGDGEEKERGATEKNEEVVREWKNGEMKVEEKEEKMREENDGRLSKIKNKDMEAEKVISNMVGHRDEEEKKEQTKVEKEKVMEPSGTSIPEREGDYEEKKDRQKLSHRIEGEEEKVKEDREAKREKERREEEKSEHGQALIKTLDGERGGVINEELEKGETEAEIENRDKGEKSTMGEEKSEQKEEKMDGDKDKKSERKQRVDFEISVEREDDNTDEVENEAKIEVENETKTEVENEAKNEVENEAKNEVENEAKNEVDNEAKNEVEKEAKNEVDNEAKNEVEKEAKNEVDNEAKNEVEKEAKNEVENEAKTEVENEAKNEVENEAKNEVENEAKNEVDNEAKNEVENEAKTEVEKEAKNEVENEGKTEVENEGKNEAENKAKTEIENEATNEANNPELKEDETETKIGSERELEENRNMEKVKEVKKQEDGMRETESQRSEPEIVQEKVTEVYRSVETEDLPKENLKKSELNEDERTETKTDKDGQIQEEEESANEREEAGRWEEKEEVDERKQGQIESQRMLESEMEEEKKMTDVKEDKFIEEHETNTEPNIKQEEAPKEPKMDKVKLIDVNFEDKGEEDNDKLRQSEVEEVVNTEALEEKITEKLMLEVESSGHTDTCCHSTQTQTVQESHSIPPAQSDQLSQEQVKKIENTTEEFVPTRDTEQNEKISKAEDLTTEAETNPAILDNQTPAQSDCTFCQEHTEKIEHTTEELVPTGDYKQYENLTKTEDLATETNPAMLNNQTPAPFDGTFSQEHVKKIEDTIEDPVPTGDTEQNENISKAEHLTTEAESEPPISDHQRDCLPVTLAENMVATILESLATSVDPSITVSDEKYPGFPSNVSKNSPSFENSNSSTDEVHEIDACEEEKEEDEREIESAEEESEMDDLDCEPAEWHTAELKPRPIYTEMTGQLEHEVVNDSLDETDFMTSTDSSQLTPSSELDPVKDTSDVEDGQEAFLMSAVDKGSYEEAQEPDYDSDDVEEATEHAFLPDSDIDIKEMDITTITETDYKARANEDGALVNTDQ